MSVLNIIDTIDSADHGLVALERIAEGIKGDNANAIYFVTIAARKKLEDAKAQLNALQDEK